MAKITLGKMCIYVEIEIISGVYKLYTKPVYMFIRAQIRDLLKISIQTQWIVFFQFISQSPADAYVCR